MEDTPNDQPKKKLLSTEMIVATAAIAVSILTLFVYIYQARIMADQQHTSVWPYVEWTTTFYSEETQEFYISVVNKGVGPALVKDTNLYLDDTLYTYHEHRDFLANLFGLERGNLDSLWVMSSVVENRVMAPGEEVKLLHVKSRRATRIPQFDFRRYKYTICYCSIYGDCWTTDGTISKEGECK
jgi:hypothetical protein